MRNPFKRHAKSSDKAPSLKKVSLPDVLKHAEYCQDTDNPHSLNEILSKKGKKPVIADLSGLTILPDTNLSEINLAGANLSGIDLSNTNCMQADLSGADLSGATCTGANFTGANLSKALCTNVRMELATLILTNFESAILDGADFFQANFSSTNLSKTRLKGTNFSGVNIPNSNISSTDFTVAVVGGLFITNCFIFNTVFGEENILTRNNVNDPKELIASQKFQLSMAENRMFHDLGVQHFNKIYPPIVKAMTHISTFFNKSKINENSEHDGFVHDIIIQDLIKDTNEVAAFSSNQQKAIIAYAKHEFHQEVDDKKAKTPEFLLKILSNDASKNKDKQPTTPVR